MDRNFIMYKCVECGTVFIIPSEHISHNNNYVTCPLHGKHKHITVIGAYDSLKECMDHEKFKRSASGAIRRD